MNSLTCLALLFASAALAQTAAPPAFEVASVKLSPPITTKEGKERVGVTVSGDRVEINFASLAELVRIAYGVKAFQVAGPDRERYDVQAKMPGGATADQMPELLQTLLAERFHLALHRENRDHAVYAMVVARSGLKLQEAEPGPDAPAAAKSAGILINRKMTLDALATFLGRFADRPVVDETGLKATYQILLEVPVEDLVRAKIAAESAARGGSDAASDPGSPVLTAIQKFGLKLESRKTPVEFLVIDRAEKLPTAN